MTTFTATIDGNTVTHAGPTWTDTYPKDKLEARAAFYERMAERYGQPTYRQSAKALRAMQKEIAA